MSQSYRLRAAFFYFAHPTPIASDAWARQILSERYPNLTISAVQIVSQIVTNLPAAAQTESAIEEAGFTGVAYRSEYHELTDTTGSPLVLVEVYESTATVIDGAGQIVFTPSNKFFGRRDLVTGALAGISGGLAAILFAMLASSSSGESQAAVSGVGLLLQLGMATVLGIVFALIYGGVFRAPTKWGLPILAGLLLGGVATGAATLTLPGLASQSIIGVVVTQLIYGVVTSVTYARLRIRVFGTFIVALSFLFLVIGVIVASSNMFMPIGASSQARSVDMLFNLMLGIATVIFLVVQTGLIIGSIRYARRKGDTSDGKPIHGNTTIEIVWTAIPAVIVVIIGFLSYQTFVSERTFAKSDMVVEVTGQQFFWTFYYPEQDISTNGELAVPIDQPVQYRIKSNDVIHAFWVPNFRIKRDAMPSQITDTRATATRAGEYPIVCAELCGAGHAQMTAKISVLTQADFEAWVKTQKSKTVDTNDPIAYGKSLFQNKGCGGCHTLADAGAAGVIGPNLDKVGIDASTRVPGETAEVYIRTSIVNPNAFITPVCPSGACAANVMPQNFGELLTEAELNALITYLSNQK